MITLPIENTSDQGLGWRLLYPFFKHQHFPKWNQEEVVQRFDEERCPLAIKLFISHRWITPEDPDPANKNLVTVVEYLSRVFMLSNGFVDRGSPMVKELVIGAGLRSAFQERQLDRCRCGSVGWLDVRSLLCHGVVDDLFYKKVPDMTRRKFYRLLKHVRVWYDYSSLPQDRRTSQQQALVENTLRHLAEIVAQSEVLALWGVDAISRGWCIFEVLTAKRLHFCAPAAVEWNMELRIMLDSLGREGADQDRKLLAWYGGRPSPNILIQAERYRSELAGLKEPEVYDYLQKNQIQCSQATDLVLLAELIHHYLGKSGGVQPASCPTAN
jgi:hypothetical protein